MRQIKGEDLEAIIERVALMYRHQKVAMIFKRPVEKKLISGKLVYTAKAGVDFNGMIYTTGQFVGFEAKEIKTKKIKNFNLAHMQKHQYQELQFIHEGGGVAFLLVHISQSNEFFRVPFPYLETVFKGFTQRPKKVGKKYVIAEECSGVVLYDDLKRLGYELPKNKNNVYVDILEGMVKR